MVDLIGDHATWHVAADAPLTSDIESLARPVSAGEQVIEIDRRAGVAGRLRAPVSLTERAQSVP